MAEIKSFEDAEKAIEAEIQQDKDLEFMFDEGSAGRILLVEHARALKFALEILRELEASELLREKFNQKRIEQTDAEIGRRIKELEGGKGLFWQDEMWRKNVIKDYKELRKMLEDDNVFVRKVVGGGKEMTAEKTEWPDDEERD